ncbi:MFS-type efflux pump MFS1 [Fulvia fulva]|nr:MFS-type efflux pump MFS1 [Fulvia fulva]WPV09984.1 MFS-type efflux pump MFS1 [Fulvia fulva]WPV23337.1 MFS-type efflux pump MFS1 [Fulvia fulva]
MSEYLHQRRRQRSIVLHAQRVRLALIFTSLVLAVFLVALDATIIATAIPTITSHFNSLSDVSWYNAAFLLTNSAFQLPFGRAYTLLNTKGTYIASIIIFEVGSVVVGTAPSSIALIIGRAIQGTGGAGIFGGAFIITAEAVPLEKRAVFNASLGGVFGIASVVGPLLGGVFTTNVTWRWCFYINLPLGGLVLAAVFFFLTNPKPKDPNRFKGQTKLQIVNKFDPIGTGLLLPSIICLLLALQWGVQYSWSSGRVIATFIVFGITIIAWSIIQVRAADNATLPYRVVSQRTVFSSALYSLLVGSAFSLIVYYLPLWFQTIKRSTPQQSGIQQLPTILSLVIASIAAGGLVVKFGYYVPFLYAGTICLSIGSGLLSTLKPDATTGEWIGYQILFAAGVGMALEQTNIAAQTVLDDKDIPAGTSLMVFARSLGGALAVGIGQTVFEQRLRGLLKTELPSLGGDVVNQLVGGSGATDLIAKVQAAAGGDQGIVATVLALYNTALTNSFYVAVAFSALTIVPCLFIEWKSVKKEKKPEKDEEKATEQRQDDSDSAKEEKDDGE